MKIIRVLNTNVVLSVDENKEDIIVMGCGLAFGKKRGDIIDETKIERIFTQDVSNLTDRFKKLIKKIPVEYLDITEKIVGHAKLKLGKELNDEIYISLTDHIYSSIQRFNDGMMIQNRLLHEIRMLYKDEYNVSIEALHMINERFNVSLIEDEAAFIALHLVNASLNADIRDTMEMTKILNKILVTIKEFYRIEYDENSLDYYRLVTHLKFFSQRVLSKQDNKKIFNGENQLFNVVKEKYKESYECVQCISNNVLNEYNYNLSDDDMLYLTIHVEKIRN
ncbi:BglG family transcription antiterminator LicT [Clostridium paraputrificum]|uniref:BglG family transcription antiterminator LicT n=1 Tax=Clostridium paraputrificum TaxID=29363 RepID=UPI000DD0E6BC|nr:PRD domain-containing protein [Clostridium paraputrificum]